MCEDLNLIGSANVLTYLKVALWLADCSPSLSHILCCIIIIIFFLMC